MRRLPESNVFNLLFIWVVIIILCYVQTLPSFDYCPLCYPFFWVYDRQSWFYHDCRLGFDVTDTGTTKMVVPNNTISYHTVKSMCAIKLFSECFSKYLKERKKWTSVLFYDSRNLGTHDHQIGILLLNSYILLVSH